MTMRHINVISVHTVALTILISQLRVHVARLETISANAVVMSRADHIFPSRQVMRKEWT